MRVVWALAALALLAGCEAPKPKAAKDKSSEFASAAEAEAFASTGTGFDYRYAYRLPSDKLKAVLQSNANGCDRLGPARCQILSMRYRVDDANHTRAVLTIKVDPNVARQFGDAVTGIVNQANGVLVDTEVKGADSTTEARSAAVVNRLRDRLANAQNAKTPDAAARLARLKIALDEIAESEAAQGASLATTPVLLTYESSNALTGYGSSQANLQNAGKTLQNSLAQLVVVLATIGPWLLLMLAIVLILRWIVHGRPVGASDPQPVYSNGDDGHGDYHSAPPPPRDNRNLIQRWFNRDDDS